MFLNLALSRLLEVHTPSTRNAILVDSIVGAETLQSKHYALFFSCSCPSLEQKTTVLRGCDVDGKVSEGASLPQKEAKY